MLESPLSREKDQQFGITCGFELGNVLMVRYPATLEMICRVVLSSVPASLVHVHPLAGQVQCICSYQEMLD